ncbi:MAG: cob(I)yrinic acid a,c-diamide adenosyltransferase [Candidatus Omnitrophota bacterium]
MKKFKKGYIQVYTGDGKGKTTAAIGLAVRAAGAGLRVYIGQFLKRGGYAELDGLKPLSRKIRIEQYGRGCLLRGKPSRQDIELARKGLARAAEIIVSRKYDVVILDEINIAPCLGLFRAKDIAGLMKLKPPDTELVLTGRGAPLCVLAKAHLVSDIRDKKHYYRRGVKARRGIEN